jgi:uncharacterized protein YprB with RNaseH-like and TPR domain
MRELGFTRQREDLSKKMKIGYLDIEATQLNASFGFMLSWCIKTKDKNEYFNSVVTKKELFDEKFDFRLTKELLETMKKYDVLYAHYGSDRRFDIPFIRTRAYANDLQDLIPNKYELYIGDTYPIARNKLKLHSNRLDAIGEIIGVPLKKTPLSAKIWQLASYGNKKALEYISNHNRRDVQLLEQIHKKLEKIENKSFTSI